MTKVFEDCKLKTANALCVAISAKNQLKILASQLDGEEKLIVNQTISLLLQSIDKMEEGLTFYLPKHRK